VSIIHLIFFDSILVMKYQLLTTDNRTMFVENCLLQQFDDYKSFIQLQYLFTIIPIPIPTYSHDYMKFIFFLVQYYLNNKDNIANFYEARQLNSFQCDPLFITRNYLISSINQYIVKCIEKNNNVYDFNKVSMDLYNLYNIIVKHGNMIIVCMMDEYYAHFSNWNLDRCFTDKIKKGVNNTSSIF
jgi:hypothetical protein